MAINWGNVTGNIQDSSGNKPGGNTSGGTGGNTPGGGGPHGSGGSNWGSGSSSNQVSPNYPSGGYDPDKDEVVDPRSYVASGQAQSDYEASLPAKPQPAGLDAIIANKDKLTQIDAGGGLNQYQVEIEKFKNSPGGKELFKKRFPNPLIKLAQGIGSYIKKGGVVGILANALGGSKEAASNFAQNASTMAKDLGSIFGLDALKTKLLGIAAGSDSADVANFIQGQQAYDPSGLEGYRDQIMNMITPKYGQDYIYDKSYMLPGATEEAVLAGSEPYSNFKEQISSDTSTDQQEIARDDERLDNLLVDLGIVGDQPLSSVTENVSETDYEQEFADTYGTKENFNNMMIENQSGKDNQPYINRTFDYDPTILGGDENIPEGTIFSENVVGQTPVLPNTFPGLEPDLSGFGQANGGYMRSFPNQNLNTESLSASDNIDDRIMKNLQFEKMSPGMMGYNQGGRVMSTYDKLKAIADNNYG